MEYPEQIITDKEGREYLLEVVDDDKDRFEVHLFHGDIWIGKAVCLLNLPDEMEWADIVIWDHVVPRRRGLCRLIPYGMWSKLKATSYRKRGLGTKLLKIVVEKARKENVGRIRGFVTNQGVADNINLLNWYQKHGFRVIPVVSPGTLMTDKVAWIQMDLK